LFDQPLIGAERLLQGSLLVVAVRLVKIDIVGLQAVERVLHPRHDVGPARALADAWHFHADLGGDYHLASVAARVQPVADDGLGFAALMTRHPFGVDVGGIDAVKAGRDETVEQLEGGRRVRRPAQHVAAEDQRRNLKPRISQFTLVHVSPRASRNRPDHADASAAAAALATMARRAPTTKVASGGVPSLGASASWRTRP